MIETFMNDTIYFIPYAPYILIYYLLINKYMGH